MKTKTAIWLLQLGTPDSTSTADSRKFLREFLIDPRVIDIPYVFRWMLVNLIISPFRSPKTAEAYRSIWTEKGSPLKVASMQLEKGLQESFGERALVKLGMRYQNPSLKDSFAEIRKAGVENLIIAPLYPQYASASTGSSLEAALEIVRREWNVPNIFVLPPFYEEEFFIEPFAEQGRKVQADKAEHVLFSFHGLPERQIKKSDVTHDHCLKTADCCEKAEASLAYCYRAQCYRTAFALAERLQIPRDRYSICFQSRLGRTPWIKPYTDELIIELAKAGKKKIAVFCPSFVSDCLETVEEIGIRGRKSFQENGGKELVLVECPNAEPSWVTGLAQALEELLPPKEKGPGLATEPLQVKNSSR